MKYRFFLGKWSLILRRGRADKQVLSTPSPPPQEKNFTERNHTHHTCEPKLQYACGAWDLPGQKDKAALERVQAMCMVYSVDSTDFRHKNSGLLLLEKYRSN